MPGEKRPVGFDVTVKLTYEDGTTEDKVFDGLAEVVFAGVAKKDGVMTGLHLEVHCPPGGVLYLTELVRQQYVVKDMCTLIARSDMMKAAAETPKIAVATGDVSDLAARMARQQRGGRGGG